MLLCTLKSRTIFALNLVLPKVQEIKVESSNNYKNYSNYFNYAIIESNTNFDIICIMSANYSTEIEFLFSPRQSNKTLALRKVRSKFSQNFIWTYNLARESSRNSSGDYYCRDSNDHENIANISIDVICMRISTFARYFINICTVLVQVHNLNERVVINVLQHSNLVI